MLYFRALVLYQPFWKLSHWHLPPLELINIQAFNERISEFIYSTFSYELCEVKSSESRSLGLGQNWQGVWQEVQVWEGGRDEAERWVHADNQHLCQHYQEQVCQGVIARDKSEELDMKKQNAEDDNTQHPQDHHQEQAHQGLIAMDKSEELDVKKQNAEKCLILTNENQKA